MSVLRVITKVGRSNVHNLVHLHRVGRNAKHASIPERIYDTQNVRYLG